MRLVSESLIESFTFIKSFRCTAGRIDDQCRRGVLLYFFIRFHTDT